MEYSRLNARTGNIVNLDINIYNNGILKSPYAILNIDIYRNSIKPANLVATIPIADRNSTNYPSPASEISEGQFVIPFYVPHNFPAPDIYFDVWNIIGSEPQNITATNLDDVIISKSGRFWVFNDIWISDDRLKTLRIGFEPLDKKLRRGEIRTIEIAVYPLPLYEYDFNIMEPIISQLNPKITIHTSNGELIVKDAECKIGIRQGKSRHSKFVIQCLLDTRLFVRGTYKYTIKTNIEDRQIISPEFYITIQ